MQNFWEDKMTVNNSVFPLPYFSSIFFFFLNAAYSNIFLFLIFMGDPNSFQNESMLNTYCMTGLKSFILQDLVNLNEGRGQTFVSNWNDRTTISPHRWVHPVLDYFFILVSLIAFHALLLIVGSALFCFFYCGLWISVCRTVSSTHLVASWISIFRLDFLCTFSWSFSPQRNKPFFLVINMTNEMNRAHS